MMKKRPSHRTSRKLALVAGLTIVLALAGCATESATSPRMDKVDYVMAAPAAPAKPDFDPKIRENSSEGAHAAIIYVWKAYEYGLYSHDPEPLSKVISETCSVCQNWVAEVKYIEPGVKLYGGNLEITGTQKLDLTGGETVTLSGEGLEESPTSDGDQPEIHAESVSVRQLPYRRYNGDTLEAESTEARESEGMVFVAWYPQHEQWLVIGISKTS